MDETKKIAIKLGLLRKRSKYPNTGKGTVRSAQEFAFLIVIDFESTCWKDTRNRSQEIIEFPAVLLNTATGEIEAEFHYYVQPQENPVLSEFCRELTGITQEDVEEGIPISVCLSQFRHWLRRMGSEKNFSYNQRENGDAADKSLCTFVTWSDWDLAVCLQYECRRKQLRVPNELASWIDLRATYRKFYGRRPQGLNGALQDLGIFFEGREHSGLHDARNTAKLAWRMVQDGCVMKITKSQPRKMSSASSVNVQGKPVTPLQTLSVVNRPNPDPKPGTNSSKAGGMASDIVASLAKPALNAPSNPVRPMSTGRTFKSVTRVREFEIYDENSHDGEGSVVQVGKTVSSSLHSYTAIKRKPAITHGLQDVTNVKVAKMSKPSPMKAVKKALQRVQAFARNKQKSKSFNVSVVSSTVDAQSNNENVVLTSSKVNTIQTVSKVKTLDGVPNCTKVVKSVSYSNGKVFKIPSPVPQISNSNRDVSSTCSNKIDSKPGENVNSSNATQTSSVFKTPLPVSKAFKTPDSVESISFKQIHIESTCGQPENRYFQSPVLGPRKEFISPENTNCHSETNCTLNSTSYCSKSKLVTPTNRGNFKTPKSSGLATNEKLVTPISNGISLSTPHSFVTPTTSLSRFSFSGNSFNSMLRRNTSSVKKTPPLCSCGRRAVRKCVQSPGPNVGRFFFACPNGRSNNTCNVGLNGKNKKQGCKFFKWD